MASQKYRMPVERSITNGCGSSASDEEMQSLGRDSGVRHVCGKKTSSQQVCLCKLQTYNDAAAAELEEEAEDSQFHCGPDRIPPGASPLKSSGNKWKRSSIGLLVLLVISVTTNICLLAKLHRMPAAPSPPDTISGSSDTGPCPQVWIRNGGRCYFFSSAEKTWDASLTDCSTQGGSLVAMDTPEERDFVFGSQPPTYFWLDACKEDVGKPWKRADGSLFNNTFPIVGEGLCAYMNERTPSSTWCDSNRQWICTKPEDSF